MNKMQMLQDLINKYEQKYPDNVDHHYFDSENPDMRYFSFREDQLVEFMINSIEEVMALHYLLKEGEKIARGESNKVIVNDNPTGLNNVEIDTSDDIMNSFRDKNGFIDYPKVFDKTEEGFRKEIEKEEKKEAKEIKDWENLSGVNITGSIDENGKMKWFKNGKEIELPKRK